MSLAVYAILSITESKYLTWTEILNAAGLQIKSNTYINYQVTSQLPNKLYTYNGQQQWTVTTSGTSSNTGSITTLPFFAQPQPAPSMQSTLYSMLDMPITSTSLEQIADLLDQYCATSSRLKSEFIIES